MFSLDNAGLPVFLSYSSQNHCNALLPVHITSDQCIFAPQRHSDMKGDLNAGGTGDGIPKKAKKRRLCSQKRQLLLACTVSAPKEGDSIPRFWQPPPSLTSLKTDTKANWGLVLACYSRRWSFKSSNQVKQSNGQHHLPPSSDMTSWFCNTQGSKPPYHDDLWVRVTRWNWLIVDAHIQIQISCIHKIHLQLSCSNNNTHIMPCESEWQDEIGWL